MSSRTLALLHLIPNPPHGGEQRVHHLLKAMAEVTGLSLAALPRQQDQTTGWPLVADFLEPPTFFSRTPVQTSRGPLERLFPGAADWPRRIRNDYSADLWNHLEKLDLGSTCTVFAGSLGMLPYAAALKVRWPHLRLVIDFDYLDPLYAWRRLRGGSTRLLSRAGYQAIRHIISLYRFSRKWLPLFDSVWVCSTNDREWARRWILRNPPSLHVIPNGIECERFSHVRPADVPRLIMTGSLMEGVNSEGAIWFAERVWNTVVKRVPQAEFWLVGRDPCPEVKQLPDRFAGIHVIENVPDMRDYLNRAAVSVAPIKFGTGTRLKILEALAAGLPVVSTTVGAEGLEVRSGHDLILADRADDFADACVTLLINRSTRERVGEAGRGTVRQYDWAVISQKIKQIVGPEAATGN